MFSNGNFFILFIILKYTSFIKFLLAENSTNHHFNNTNTNYNDISTTITERDIYNLTTSIAIEAAAITITTTTTTTTSPLINSSITTSHISKRITLAKTANNSFSNSIIDIIPNTSTFSNNSLYMAKLYEKQKLQKSHEENIKLKESDDNKYESIEDNELTEFLPKPAALFASSQNLYSLSQQQDKTHNRMQQQPSAATTQNAPLPIFPERSDAVYFIVAVIGGGKLWGRTLARTLIDMGPPFGSPLGPPLRPLYVDLPSNGRFSVKVLTSLCQQIENMPLAGVVVIGDGQSARAVALSGNAMKVPVLWARGGTANIYGVQREAQTELQSMLQPSAREILIAIRCLFLQTHWHSFFVVSDPDATMVLSGVEGNSLRDPPLHPKILPLATASDGDIFRQLTEISRSTRGIVLLLCNLISARKIMSQAKRLNMAGGHFIWLWADTTSTTEFFDLNNQYPLSMDDEKIFEYPEAVKQQYSTSQIHDTSEINTDIISSSSQSAEDFSDRRFHFDDMEKIQQQQQKHSHQLNHKHDIKRLSSTLYHDKLKDNQFQKQQPSKQQTQTSRRPSSPLKKYNFDEPPVDTGRYIFGLKRNGEDHSEEVISRKRKRSNSNKNNENENKNENNFNDDLFINEFDDINHRLKSVERSSENIGTLIQIKLNGANLNHRDSDDEVLTSDKASSSTTLNYGSLFDYIDRTNDNNNYNSFDTNMKININNANSSNKNIKPKRTSLSFSSLSTSSLFQYGHFHGKNSSSINLTPKHVLFHHFEDFPVGLLALRPIKMPVDRNFIRSTIRLFALTWSQTEYSIKVTTQTLTVNRKNYNNNNNNRNNNQEDNKNNDYVDNNKFEDYFTNYRSYDRNNPYYSANENNEQMNRSIRKQQQQHHQQQKQFTSFKTNFNINNYNNDNDNNNKNNRINRNVKNNSFNNNDNDMRTETVNNQQQVKQINYQYLNNHNENENEKLFEKLFNENFNDEFDSNVNINYKNLLNDYKNDSYENYSNISRFNMNNSSISSSKSNIKIEHNINNSRSDLNKSTLTISSYNQNLSGLINSNKNESNKKEVLKQNINSNDNNNLKQNNSKIKRSKTPWSPLPSSIFSTLLSRDSSSREQQQNKFNSGDRYRNNNPYYRGGCFGTANSNEIIKAEIFAKALNKATKFALSGQKLADGNLEKPLITNFELLNLVPDDNMKNKKIDIKDSLIRRRGPRKPENELSKWRRVGFISGIDVQLDTIVWPGGDIVVSGLSARARTVFRIVTALAPPFVMESELDEDGLCLRGLPCHRLSPNGQHNLTLMFNAIETRDRLREDAVEHGVKPPKDSFDTYDHSLYETKCCYGLSMDLLDNIATELGFEFHLYIARDELFGTKYSNFNDKNAGKSRANSFDDREKYTTDFRNRRNQQQQQNQYLNHHYHHQQQQQREYNNNPLYNTDELSSHHHQKYQRDNKNMMKDRYNENQFDNHENLKRERIYRASYERRINLNADDYSDEYFSSSSAEFFDSDEGSNEYRDNNYDDDILSNEKEDEEFDEMNYFGWSSTRYGSKLREINKHDIRNNKFTNKKRYKTKAQWNGIIGDLISGSADMSFAPLSVSKSRSEVIDFSVPYFHSGVTLLAAPQSRSEIPLLAFLLPFSPELWIAIFTSLNVTAIAVAIYEWLSPFGLNPWGRQRSKNFSMSSALWVMWGLLCGHLVAFKAPKSWPNKFLINVWGGFSVIFIASYTANIAALIAGLFFHNAGNRPEVSLLTSRVGAPTASAAETYVKKKDPHIWEHMKKYTIRNIEEGIRCLKNGSLDLIMGDTPILDYYRATDHGCTLQRIGEPYVHDTYAIGMTKGFPLRESISGLIAKYSSNGYLDILTEKWYGGLPCFKDTEFLQPRPLGVEAVAGVFLLLGLGIILGVLILILEYLFYKYTLPILRHKPKGTVWRSRNIMFFSQKLYRFINCVELVSPHHAARELVHTLRQGQIASLFQKSIKRKEDEQRRRRKSKAQFFEMIQEIRRVQQQERANPKLEVVTEDESVNDDIITDSQHKPKSSPKPKLLFGNRNKESRSRSNSSTLNVRRFSTDSILSERLDTIGRRLSRDLTNSPPDLGRRFETFGKNHSNNKFDTYSAGSVKKELSNDRIAETKFDTYGGKDCDRPPILPIKKHQNKRVSLNAETFTNRINGYNGNKMLSCDDKLKIKIRPIPITKESLVHPICQEDSNKALLRDRMHEELKKKYGDDDNDGSNNIYASCSSRDIKDYVVGTRSISNQINLSSFGTIGGVSGSQYHTHSRQKSADGGTIGCSIEGRPPIPIPVLHFSPQNEFDTAAGAPTTSSPIIVSITTSNMTNTASTSAGQSSMAPALPPKVSPKTNLKQISLERLSRKDLLKLSESSQSEIHDYLSKTSKSANNNDKSIEPP